MVRAGRLDTGARDTERELHEFSDDFSARIAQRERALRAAGHTSRQTWRQSGEESEHSTHRERLMRDRNAGSRQGIIPHSKIEIERGVMDLFKVSRLLERSRLAHEPDECVLVRHQVRQQDDHVTVVEAMHRHPLES